MPQFYAEEYMVKLMKMSPEELNAEQDTLHALKQREAIRPGTGKNLAEKRQVMQTVIQMQQGMER